MCKAENAVSVQTGSSVQLDIQIDKLLPFDTLVWMNHESENIVTFSKKTVETEINNYRVVFNQSTFFLTLKNTQKTDSGLYTAEIFGSKNINVAKYRVSVIDAVEAPVLTVNSNRSSSDSCTVNFTCRAHELMIDSSYQNNSCSPEEVTSQINTLILDCSEESIICNHSNPVSWKEDRINIIQLCNNNKKNDSKNDKTGSSLLWPVVASGAMAVIILIIIFLSVFLYCRRKKASRNAET
uniref:Si:dkey-53k12.1 n=1 Tax=Cyprinus carpio TaxID=7962 RepID=A0A8C2A7D9_CYPCA